MPLELSGRSACRCQHVLGAFNVELTSSAPETIR
jgi:hypothetical protein